MGTIVLAAVAGSGLTLGIVVAVLLLRRCLPSFMICNVLLYIIMKLFLRAQIQEGEEHGEDRREQGLQPLLHS